MKAKRGEAQRFMQMALVYESDECCIWPFHRNAVNGYAMMSYSGRPNTVHRIVCEIMHGPAPSDIHEAAHSCGNGHLGCINHRHLSWKTPKENAADQLVHGTRARGSRNGHAKINEAIAAKIKSSSLTGAQLAMIHGISQQLVCDIRKGRRWSY